jgi:DNA-binding NarL/FixJ family response regulator
MPSIKVLVIGEHRLLVEALGFALETHHDVEVVGAHTDADLAMQQVHEICPDVAFLVNCCAQLDIVRLTASLRGVLPELRVIVLSGIVDELALSAYVHAGVAGHLTTERSLGELIRAIQQVHDGELLFAPDRLVRLLTHPPAQPMRKPLAPRELEVLQVLGTGASTEQAAAQLEMSVHTLRTHLKHAMRKLQARSKLQAILIALKAGLIELPA